MIKRIMWLIICFVLIGATLAHADRFRFDELVLVVTNKQSIDLTKRWNAPDCQSTMDEYAVYSYDNHDTHPVILHRSDSIKLYFCEIDRYSYASFPESKSRLAAIEFNYPTVDTRIMKAMIKDFLGKKAVGILSREYYHMADEQIVEITTNKWTGNITKIVIAYFDAVDMFWRHGSYATKLYYQWRKESHDREVSYCRKLLKEIEEGAK